MIVKHYRKVKTYFPVVRIRVFCSLVCYILLEALWSTCVLGFASVVKKLEKRKNSPSEGKL